MVLYDVVNFKPTDFTVKKTDAAHNPATTPKSIEPEELTTSVSNNIVTQNNNAVNSILSKNSENVIDGEKNGSNGEKMTPQTAMPQKSNDPTVSRLAAAASLTPPALRATSPFRGGAAEDFKANRIGKEENFNAAKAKIHNYAAKNGFDTETAKKYVDRYEALRLTQAQPDMSFTQNITHISPFFSLPDGSPPASKKRRTARNLLRKGCQAVLKEVIFIRLRKKAEQCCRIGSIFDTNRVKIDLSKPY